MIGEPRRLDHKYKYRVEVDGFASAKFHKCGGLEVELNKVEYWEGGSLYPITEPGRTKTTDLVLDRGVGLDRDFFLWLKQAYDYVRNGGALPADIKRNLDVVQLARDGSEVKRWTVYQAWPTKFKAGEWDSTSDEVVLEEITLCYEGFDEVVN